MATPLPIPQSVLNDTPLRAKLVDRVNAQLPQGLSDEECWEWQGYTIQGGYGRTDPTIGGVRFRILVHRLTYAWEYGDPFPWVIDHLCGNPPCVNPKHLEATTIKINSLRGESPIARQARSQHCVNGHPLYGDNVQHDEKRGRICLTCRSERYEKWAAKNTTHRKHGPGKTECKNGHPWIPGNIRESTKGRSCIACERLSAQAQRERKKAGLPPKGREVPYPGLAERIVAVLREKGPLPVFQIAAELPDVERTAVAVSMQRMTKRGQIVDVGHVDADWGRGVRKVKSYTVG